VGTSDSGLVLSGRQPNEVRYQSYSQKQHIDVEGTKLRSVAYHLRCKAARKELGWKTQQAWNKEETDWLHDLGIQFGRIVYELGFEID